MDTDSLRSFLIQHNLDAATLYYLLDQGIEVEELRLQLMESIGGESLDSYVKIMQGARFLDLLIASRSK